MTITSVESDDVNLTETQLEAVRFDHDPKTLLSIQAGPGSGKTLTLIHRIKYLIDEKGVLPEGIIVLSMTNRTVNSLRANLSRLIGQTRAEKVKIRTFHSFAANLVDSYIAEYFPGKAIKVLLDDVSWRSFAAFFLNPSHMRGEKVKKYKDKVLNIAELERWINQLKCGESTLEHVAKQLKVPETELKESIQYLEDNGMIRYSDFISDAIELMEKSLSIENPIGELANVEVVIVDEFQDMQPNLLQLIQNITRYPSNSGENKHLTIAGDINQCIYEFLKSSPNITNEFIEKFNSWKIDQIVLKETFRLSPEVLEAAVDVALKPAGLGESMQLFESTKESSFKPVLYSLSNELEEYDFIAEEIWRLICQSGGLLQFSDFIILVRSNREVDLISKKLSQQHGFDVNKFTSVPDWIQGNTHIFLDVLNMLKNGFGSDFALLCIMMKLGANKPFLKKLLLSYNKWKLELPDRKRNLLEEYVYTLPSEKDPIFNTDVKKHLKLKILKFLTVVRQERDSSPLIRPKQVIQSIVNIVHGTELMDYINKVPATEQQRGEIVLKNLNSFSKSVKFAYGRYIMAKPDCTFIEFFLHTFSEDEPVIDKKSINISTVHKAKGLEFPVVFIPGCKSHYAKFPSSPWRNMNGVHAPSAEEARLLFVAMTRAKHLLYIGSINSSKWSKLFHKEPEKINTEYVSAMASSLNRKMPSADAIITGNQVYKSLGIASRFIKRI
ncbi:uncharacterized protein SPAPADRAFT_147526 [Spathaspora passalidarum NRRL Y-27907]|uniref:DNA 3'-5' helicase n=1 Tax=Spathaspora passalidarum (strain NRRL Y-27907 / 11-Y1) TaxID=619300 RepID=G3AI91_SPAPN|nr:uncharacterized protein SPAPADRAFT_147526 [Spathaspora passalidarum NRRL Y-27907]EGW33658.1 hypothetical protein SPAPADRAFT_147526 [Spathaspora passalidarum NRRL Y-27907]